MASPLETLRTDPVSSEVTYIGTAPVGSSESAQVWRIKKVVTDVDGRVSILFVDGNTDVDSAWADRATYTYS